MPLATIPLKIDRPLAVLSWTQQSSTAVRWITTARSAAGRGEWLGDGRADGRCVCLGAGPPAPCAAIRETFDDGHAWYTTKPTISASASAMAALQLGPRRSFSLIGLDGSKTSAAVIACGAPCAVSYSRMSASGSAPTALAILRIWPLA